MPNTVANQIALACALDGSAARVSGELRGLVDVARRVSTLPEPQIDPAFASRLEARLLIEPVEGVTIRRLTLVPAPSLTPSKANDEAAASADVIALPRRRLVVRKALVAAVAAASLTALPVAASASALPGTLMYPVKQSVERLELALTRGEVADGFKHLKHAVRRLDEADQLVALDQPRLVPPTLDRMNDSLEAGAALILRHAPDTATIERLADTLRSSNKKLSTLLDDAPGSVQQAIFESLATAHALTIEVQEALHAPAFAATPAQAVTPRVDNASWKVPPADSVALPAKAAVPVDDAGSGSGKPGPSKPGGDNHETDDTSSSCRAHSYDGPEKELVYGTCDLADVNAQIDPPDTPTDR